MLTVVVWVLVVSFNDDGGARREMFSGGFHGTAAECQVEGRRLLFHDPAETLNRSVTYECVESMLLLPPKNQ